MQRAREGDFLETYGGLIFDVKGFMHPPEHVIAFLRYYPDSSGIRTRKGVRYQKIYALEARRNFLQEKFPEFLRYDNVFGRTMSEVPISRIKTHYEPYVYLQRLKERRDLDPVEQDAVDFADELRREAKIPKEGIGVTGSILIQLHGVTSDIDLVCYGSREARRVYSALKRLLKDDSSAAKPYTEIGLRKLFTFRKNDTELSYPDFLRVETQKILQGTYRGRDYYVRLLKDWGEYPYKYGELRYTPLGRTEITAIISDDSESIFTPCRYSIREVQTTGGLEFPVKEITSYRGRFCEQAKKDDTVMAAGEIEQVMKGSKTHYQIILGSSKEDFLKVI